MILHKDAIGPVTAPIAFVRFATLHHPALSPAACMWNGQEK